jgi:hypothetical protein
MPCPMICDIRPKLEQFISPAQTDQYSAGGELNFRKLLDAICALPYGHVEYW